MSASASASSGTCSCRRNCWIFDRTRNPVRFLSMRFAAKEAIVKALGTGFANGMWLRDAGVVSRSTAASRGSSFPRGASRSAGRLGVGDGHLTLSDEAGLVVAVAILMKSPA